MTKKILVQTTIEPATDDWAIERFSMMVQLLSEQQDASGLPVFDVIARDRESGGRPDSLLSRLDESDFDVLWLLAVDIGNGLHEQECQAIDRFRRRGGGLMVARDHMDLGSSVCALSDIGQAHHFHTRNQETDARRQVNDDKGTPYIHWPNYHSGRNGDYQELQICQPMHPLLASPSSVDGAIHFFPSHPHEGAISAPLDQSARVIATGRSKASSEAFNLAVAFEGIEGKGRAIAQSTFHHFSDYNWDASTGCPSFVSEAPGDGMTINPDALKDIQRYVINAANWLAGN